MLDKNDHNYIKKHLLFQDIDKSLQKVYHDIYYFNNSVVYIRKLVCLSVCLSV